MIRLVAVASFAHRASLGQLHSRLVRPIRIGSAHRRRPGGQPDRRPGDPGPGRLRWGQPAHPPHRGRPGDRLLGLGHQLRQRRSGPRATCRRRLPGPAPRSVASCRWPTCCSVGFEIYPILLALVKLPIPRARPMHGPGQSTRALRSGLRPPPPPPPSGPEVGPDPRCRADRPGTTVVWMRENTLKTAWSKGEPTIGLWLSAAEPFTVEMLCRGRVRLHLPRHPARPGRLPQRRAGPPGPDGIGRRSRSLRAPVERTGHHRQAPRRRDDGHHRPDGQHGGRGRGRGCGLPLRPARAPGASARPGRHRRPRARLLRRRQRAGGLHPDDRDRDRAWRTWTRSSRCLASMPSTSARPI